MPTEGHLSDVTRPSRAARRREAADLAAAQHGPVHHDQLLDLGFSPRSVGRLVEEGWLCRVHRCVYAVGHAPLTRHGWWSAALLAGGPDAALSHWAAAGLRRIRPARERIDVTVPRRRRPQDGIVFHRARLPEDERDVIDGLAVTSVARTLLDLAAVADAHQVERAANEAQARRLGDRLPIEHLLLRHRGHRGVAILRTALSIGELGLDLTESELEEAFLVFLDEYGLPRPELNRWIGTRRCDAVWPDARLIVELDSRMWHGTTRAFEQDRARDRDLAVAGWRTVRVTAGHLRDQRDALAADLRALLER